MAMDLSVTYGGFTVGGASATSIIPGTWSVTDTYEQVVVEFDVLLQGTLSSLGPALQTAYRDPLQDLTVAIGGSDHVTVKPSTNDGFNTFAEVIKIGSDLDTANSRVYRIRIVGERPADDATFGGRRWKETAIAVVELETEQRQVTITGKYTATPGFTAQANFDANADTFIGTVITALTGTWEEIENTTVRDDQNKNINFKIVQEEIIFNQSLIALDDPAIVNPQMGATVLELNQKHSIGGTKQPVKVAVFFRCGVVKSVETNLKSLYENTIRPFMISHGQDISNGGTVVLTRDNPGIDAMTNRIDATIEFSLYGDATFHNSRVEFNEDESFGKKFIAKWAEGNNPYAYNEYQGPAVKIRTVRKSVVVQGAPFGGFEIPTVTEVAILPPEDFDNQRKGRFIPISRITFSTPFEIGIEPFTDSMTEMVEILVSFFADIYL